MSSNKRQVTEYEVLTNEPIYFASGIKVPASSGTPSAGAIARNATTGAVEVAGVSDSTYHSVCLRPALTKEFASASVSSGSFALLDFSSSTSYEQRATANTFGSIPVAVLPAGTGSYLVTVTGEWSANASGKRYVTILPVSSTGGTPASGSLQLQSINPQSSGTTEHTQTHLVVPQSIPPDPDIAGIAITLFQDSGSTLTFDNVRVSFLAI